jgi:hypothetical protein
VFAPQTEPAPEQTVKAQDVAVDPDPGPEATRETEPEATAAATATAAPDGGEIDLAGELERARAAVAEIEARRAEREVAETVETAEEDDLCREAAYLARDRQADAVPEVEAQVEQGPRMRPDPGQSS